MPAIADALLDVNAGVLHDDNLTRAQEPDEFRADRAASLSVAASYFWALSGNDGASLAAIANGEAYDRYRGLSHVELGAGAAYRHKFGLGWNVPWTAVNASVTHDDYRDRLRDSVRVAAQLEVGKRASAAVDASAGLFYERRYDDNGTALVPGYSGKVFDLAARGVFVRAGFALTDRLLLDGRIALRTGDVESTSEQYRAIFLVATAITADPVFGDPALFAYRLDGRTRSAAVTASWALDDRSSLNAGIVAAHTTADQGLEYRTRTANIAYAFRY
jgi:hypothetical protein